MENKEALHICYACNAQGVDLLKVSIASVLGSKNLDTKISFYIINEGFNSQIHQDLYDLAKDYNNIDINFISANSQKYSKYFAGYNKHIPVSTYLRFELFSSLSHLSRVLYLDIDTMVFNDLTPLYLQDIQGVYASVVAELPLLKNHFERIFNYEHSKNDLNLKYFNAGVLLINVANVLQDCILNEISSVFNRYGKNFAFDDQDLLNILWYNKVNYIPMRYNVYSIFYYNTLFLNYHYQQYLKKEINNITIAHFTRDKPYSARCLHISQMYWLHMAHKLGVCNVSKIKIVFLHCLYYLKKIFFIMLNKEYLIIKIGSFIITMNSNKLLPINYYHTKTHRIVIILGLKLSVRKKSK